MGIHARVALPLGLLLLAGSCSRDESVCKLAEGCVYGECDVIHDRPGGFQLCVDPQTNTSFVRTCIDGELAGGYLCEPERPGWTVDAGFDAASDATSDGATSDQ